MDQKINNKNEMINNGDKSVLKYFKLDCKEQLENLNKPWCDIIDALSEFRKERSLDRAKKIISFYYEFSDPKHAFIFRQLIINLLTLDVPIDISDPLQYYTEKNHELGVFLFNIHAYLSFKYNKTDMLYDYLKLVHEPKKKNTDYFIFMYYSGIINTINNKFKIGFAQLKEAIKAKRLRKFFYNDFLLVSLFGFNLPNLEIKHPYYKLKECIKIGLVSQVESLIPFNSQLYEMLIIYLPLVSFRNLLFRLYTNPLLKLDFNMFKLKKNEVYLYVLNCIDQGLIRANINLDKELIIFSKLTPFINILE
ncbi:hypothetical protein HERIO_633 [Hepatospora eriocheir]|uniref:Uncharacterized protein n=1 Tax=Hepatospora eriocheir TaxID=1081669 RepID=A0A1X0QCS9_9MICR|nr:hypothetical protein HERIO_633 [Hepatospora eriocheir]